MSMVQISTAIIGSIGLTRCAGSRDPPPRGCSAQVTAPHLLAPPAFAASRRRRDVGFRGETETLQSVRTLPVMTPNDPLGVPADRAAI
jgi:hypothetical protein